MVVLMSSVGYNEIANYYHEVKMRSSILMLLNLKFPGYVCTLDIILHTFSQAIS